MFHAVLYNKKTMMAALTPCVGHNVGPIETFQFSAGQLSECQ